MLTFYFLTICVAWFILIPMHMELYPECSRERSLVETFLHAVVWPVVVTSKFFEKYDY